MAEQQSRSGALEAAQDKLSLSVAGMGGVSFQITGTFSGTITFEISTDEYGLTFRTLQVASVTTGTAVTTATAAGMWTGNCAGAQIVRARMSSYSSGTALVTIRSSLASPGGGGSGGGGGGAVTIADGADVAEGATTDAAVLSDADGTVSAKLRGLIALQSPLDLDTGVGMVPVGGHYLALPDSGGPVVGGTSTNPIQVGDAGGSITVDGSVTVTQPTGSDLHAVIDSGTLTTVSAVTAITNALPAGTNAIGKLAANSGVDIGDVDVTSVGGNVTVVQPTGSNLHTVIDSGTITTVSAVTSLTNALPAGTNAIGKLAANSGVDIGDVDVTSISAGSNLIGDVGIQPRAANGLSTMNATSSDGATALTSTAQVIKASAGLLYGYYIYNPNTIAAYVQFYNTAAASVTVGTTNPLFMLTIPAGAAANLISPLGITFSNAGWSWAATSTAGGNGAPTTALDAVAWYN